MHISIFGAGYVGLVQAAILAEYGHNVICVDVDQEKIDKLLTGIIPIHEPGLSDIITHCVSNGCLSFTTDSAAAIAHAEVIFIAVGTPPNEDGSADLKHVIAVASTIAQYASEDKVIVIKSTVPVGTSDKVKHTLSSNTTCSFHIASNPEFLKEGAAVYDCRHPDRIIIGSDSEHAFMTLRLVYAPFNHERNIIIEMDARSSELTKYAANGMLAAKISYMNELSNIAEALGADIEHVRVGIGSDPRIGYKFINPGCGYGGSCFPKDVSALIKTSAENNVDVPMLRAIETVNTNQKNKLFQYIQDHYQAPGVPLDLSGKTFAVWGLSFKPHTDDIRFAPSLTVIQSLLECGASIQAYDPEAKLSAISPSLLNSQKLTFTRNATSCLEGADALIVCTEWDEFIGFDPKSLSDKISDKVVFDGRNIYNPAVMIEHGIDYYGIGRGLSVKR
jgi:UDPglucose 6-dehydrogenase